MCARVVSEQQWDGLTALKEFGCCKIKPASTFSGHIGTGSPRLGSVCQVVFTLAQKRWDCGRSKPGKLWQHYYKYIFYFYRYCFAVLVQHLLCGLKVNFYVATHCASSHSGTCFDCCGSLFKSKYWSSSHPVPSSETKKVWTLEFVQDKQTRLVVLVGLMWWVGLKRKKPVSQSVPPSMRATGFGSLGPSFKEVLSLVTLGRV